MQNNFSPVVEKFKHLPKMWNKMIIITYNSSILMPNGFSPLECFSCKRDMIYAIFKWSVANLWGCISKDSTY